VPTNVIASDGTFVDKVQVTWTASLWATSYTVYRATSTSRRATKVAIGTASGTTYDDTTASVMVTYYYYVKATNPYGTSGYSAYNKGYRSDGRPPVPTNVIASDGTFMDKVQVTWTASSWANSYTVYRATSTSRWATKVAIGTTSDTTYDDTTASVGKTYYYWVKASNPYGTSGFSAYNTGYR
jgi:fibronectin type 3 domain-containing protein